MLNSQEVSKRRRSSSYQMRLISRGNERLRQQAETEESPGEQQSSYVLRPGNIDQSDSSDGRSVRPRSSESQAQLGNQMLLSAAVAHVHGGLQRRELAGSRKSELLKDKPASKGQRRALMWDGNTPSRGTRNFLSGSRSVPVWNFAFTLQCI